MTGIGDPSSGEWRVVWRGAGERLFVERQHGSDHPRHRFRSNEPGDGAVVIVRDEDGRVLLLEIHRHVLGRTLLELPRGQAEADDPDPVATATRELLEESGHTMTGGRVLGQVYPDSGLSGDAVHVVVATGVTRGSADGAEFPVQHWLDADELADAVRRGELRDGISLAALALLSAAGA